MAVFIVKHKVFEPNAPMVKFKPATATTLVNAKNKAEAIQKTNANLAEKIRKQYPKADFKLMDCKRLNYQFFVQ